MNELLNNKAALWVIGGLALLMGGVFFGGPYVVNKVADRVVIKLQKEYSPSPYGPVFDPDKVDPESMRRKTAPPPQKTRANDWDQDWNRDWNQARTQ